MSELQALITKAFPSSVYELSDTAGLESPDDEIYGIFIPETDGDFLTGTQLEEGRVFTFTKGIPVYGTFTKVIIDSGQAGKLYKK